VNGLGDPAAGRPSEDVAAGRAGNRWPGVAAVGITAVAGALVAVAAAGGPLKEAGHTRVRLVVSPWLLLVPITAAVALWVIAMSSVRTKHRKQPSTRRPLWMTILSVAVLLGVLALLRSARPPSTEVQPPLDVGPSSPVPSVHGTAWPVWLAVTVGAVIGLVAMVARRHQQRRHAGARAEVSLESTEDALRAVEASLVDLAEPTEPRQAVIAAYARLLDGLHDAGAGRRPPEAPFEHVTRALEQLGVRPEPLRELTVLFAEARFSRHPITEEHRHAAQQALDAARRELSEVMACA
jgi:uncharacterized protein DUF4129